MKITTDYHIHSTFSSDGSHSPAIICQRALDLGLTEIAITEHAEWHPTVNQKGFPQVAEYFVAIEQCRARFEPLGLTVYTGVELGNPHEHYQEVTALLSAYPFDVIIASLHWLYGENIHLESCFANRNPDDVYTDYFTELGRMAANFDFDIMAHFDRIIWRGSLLGATFDPWRLAEVIQESLSTIARYGRALELNTRYLSHTPNWNEALVTMFHWFLLAGGTRVVVSSDAHRADGIGRDFFLAQEILSRAGFDLPTQLFQIESGHSLTPEPLLRIGN
jgi:histidinol-phosphatase (PHP family)